MRRKLLEPRILFKKLELLVERKVFVGLEPVAHLPSAFLAGMVGIRGFLWGGLHKHKRSSAPAGRVYARGNIQGNQS